MSSGSDKQNWESKVPLETGNRFWCVILSERSESRNPIATHEQFLGLHALRYQRCHCPLITSHKPLVYSVLCCRCNLSLLVTSEFRSSPSRWFCLCWAAPASARGSRSVEYMYVSAQETSLRDRVATMYNKIGTVHGGDRVEVLEKSRRFLRVRTDGGQEGWIEERSLVPQDVYDAFQKLASDAAGQQVQAHGTARSELNMHVTPSREGEHLYLLKDGEKVEVLKRATAEKNPPKPVAATVTQSPKGAAPAQPKCSTRASSDGRARQSCARKSVATQPPDVPKPVMEDWYLVRELRGPCRLGAAAHDRPRCPTGDCAICRGPAHHGLLRAEYRAGGRQAGATVPGVAERAKDGLPWEL